MEEHKQRMKEQKPQIFAKDEGSLVYISFHSYRSCLGVSDHICVGFFWSISIFTNLRYYSGLLIWQIALPFGINIVVEALITMYTYLCIMNFSCKCCSCVHYVMISKVL